MSVSTVVSQAQQSRNLWCTILPAPTRCFCRSRAVRLLVSCRVRIWPHKCCAKITQLRDGDTVGLGRRCGRRGCCSRTRQLMQFAAGNTRLGAFSLQMGVNVRHCQACMWSSYMLMVAAVHCGVATVASTGHWPPVLRLEVAGTARTYTEELHCDFEAI